MQSPIRTALRKVKLVDWHHRHTRDAMVLLGIGAVTFAAAHFYDLPPQLLQFCLDHADWEMDDLIFVVFMLSAAMMIYGFRRYQDLSREIKARTAAESEARMMARHDPLTGLPNRRFFEERLTDYLHTTSATSQFAVLMLDLDGFKPVNDSHGHAVGDKALVEFARRVSVMCRTDVFLARRRRRVRHPHASNCLPGRTHPLGPTDRCDVRGPLHGRQCDRELWRRSWYCRCAQRRGRRR